MQTSQCSQGVLSQIVDDILEQHKNQIVEDDINWSVKIAFDNSWIFNVDISEIVFRTLIEDGLSREKIIDYVSSELFRQIEDDLTCSNTLH